MKIAKLFKEWLTCKNEGITYSRRWCFVAAGLNIITSVVEIINKEYLVCVAFIILTLSIIFSNLCSFVHMRKNNNL